jgi:hypothetical protein
MANSRTRIISQSKAVFISPTGFTTGASTSESSGYVPDQLHRIDTLSFDIDIAGARTDIREFGQLARIASVTMSDINPSLSFGYYLADGENEARLGFNNQGISPASNPVSQFISGIVSEDTNKRQKNIYVLTTKEGEDAFSSGELLKAATWPNVDNVGFGNVTLNSYTASFSVGEIPRVDIEAECSNIVFNTESLSGKNPSINQLGARQVGDYILATTGYNDVTSTIAPSTGDMRFAVLKPDDITITFSNPTFEMGGTDFSDMHVQSATLEVPLTRTNIEALGSARPVAKPLDFPIDVTLSFSSLLKNFDDGSLDLILTGTAGDETTNITLSITDEQTTGIQNKWILQGAQLDSQSFNQGLDDNETVDLTFSASIGAPNTTEQGIFYTGAFTGVVDATGKNRQSSWPLTGIS